MEPTAAAAGVVAAAVRVAVVKAAKMVAAGWEMEPVVAMTVRVAVVTSAAAARAVVATMATA